MSLNPVFQKIRNDAANGKNVNMVICGAPRTGKSWSALRLAERLDDAFSTDRVVWTIEQFMSLITSKTLKDGSVVIFDEAGVSVSNRNWYEKMNKDFMFIMQTYGYRHLIVIMTTPSLSYIDSASRRLFNYYCETLKMDKRNERVLLKIRQIQHNAQTGKTYFRSPVASGRKIAGIWISAPTEKTQKAYEALSEMWKNTLTTEIQKSTAENTKKDISIDEMVTKVMENVDGFKKTFKGRTFINEHTIRAMFGVGQYKAKTVKAKIEQKLGMAGYART